MQKDLISVGQYAQQPKDDHSAFLNPSGPSDAAFKKPCNPPSVLSNTVELFKKLINDASTSSHTSSNKAVGQQSLQLNSESVYGQKSIRESKDQSYSAAPSQISQFFHKGCDQASTSHGSSSQPSESKQKSNLATQMERFLGALNKADSNLLSTLLRDSRKASDPLEDQRNQKIPQDQAERTVSSGNELYDPFKETDCSEENYRKMSMNPMLGGLENTQDDLLPHERAVVDGSGFSKIVGMKYGIEAKPETLCLYGEASGSQSRLFEEQEKNFNKCDQFKLSQDRYDDKPCFEDSYAEDRKRYKVQQPSGRYRVESSPSLMRQKSEDDSDDVDQKTSQFKKIQDLLQTIGLNLDTTEVSKLADRTKERLYGKKVKPQSSRSSNQKDERSLNRYDRRGSSHSTDSEDVISVSPAKTSKREVYMSYLDSLKYRHEVAADELDLFSLKRTIRNSPETKQITSDPYKIAQTKDTVDSYKPISAAFSLAQPIGVHYNQMPTEYSSAAHHLQPKQDSQECSYAVDRGQNSYGAVSLNPLYYATGYPTPSSHFPSYYEDYTASAGPSSMMPPSPVPFYPTVPTYNTPGSFGPTPYPCTSGQYGFGSSGYVTQQAKTKPTAQNRCLKTIQTVQTEKVVSKKHSVVKEVHTVISIQTDKDPNDTEDKAEYQAAPVAEDDIKAKQKKRVC